jgi:serine/threonine protein kinase
MSQKITVPELNLTFNLDSAQVINSGGGEGAIYRIDNSRAIKVFHEPENQKNKIANLEKTFSQKENPWIKLKTFATVPEFLAKDSSGQVVGYLMQNCEGWNELNTLYAEDPSISLKTILLVFSKLHQALSAFHDQGFIIGDFNGSNILLNTFNGNVQLRAIDTDSWGINRPDLGLSFGPSALDLEVIHPERLIAQEQGKTLPPFSAKHDWWAFTYLLTKCLTKRDPFEQGDFWGLGAEERRKAGLAAFHNGVNLGSAKNYAIHLRIGITLKHFLKRWLSCSEGGKFPLSLIENTITEIINCPRCKEEVNGRLTLCPFPDCAQLL